MRFVPVLKSEEFGVEEFAPRLRIENALTALKDIQLQCLALNDGIEREYLIRVEWGD